MKITYTNQSGQLCVVHPVEPKEEGETEAEYLARIAAMAVPEGVDWQAVSDDAIPKDRTYRAAWAHDGKAVSVDMAKAREVHKTRLRAMRSPLLAALDVDMMRALESGDASAIAAIKDKKQALRDVTKNPAIEAAATPEALAAAVPEVLK